MIKNFLTLPTLAAAMMACETPSPEFVPDQNPTPQKTARTFPTATSVDAVCGYLDSVKYKVGEFDSYVLNIGDMSLDAEQNDKILPNAISRAATLKNLSVKKIGKVYTAGDNTDNKIIWDVSAFKSHGMQMMQNPVNCAWPYARDMAEQAEYHKLGYASVERISIPNTHIKLTQANSARFDEYINELKAEHPNGIILDMAGIVIPEIRMEQLANLTCEKLPTSGTVEIKDSKIRISAIKSSRPEWGIGTGSSRSGEWFRLIQANGITPTFLWTGISFAQELAPIKIGAGIIVPENIVSDFIMGSPGASNQQYGNYVLVSPDLLPPANITRNFAESFSGNTLENAWTFGWSCSELALAAWLDSGLDGKLGQTNVGIVPLQNCEIVNEYLKKRNIELYHQLPIGTYKWVNHYTNYEKNKVSNLVNKRPIGMPVYNISANRAGR